MDKINGSTSNIGRKTSGIGRRVALVLFALILVSVLVWYFSRILGQDSKLEPIIINTTKTVKIISQMRIDLLKSADLAKGAVMAITDEESLDLAGQSRKSADEVEHNYHELEGLISATKIDNELRLLKDFSDNWKNLRVIDKELLSLAVENTNIKAANLSYTEAAQAIAKFERFLSELIAIPNSDAEGTQVAKLAYQAITAAFMIYSLEAPHINEAQDEKMDELEKIMGRNEKTVRDALRNISGLTDQKGRPIFNNALSAFEKFMEIHKEVLRLSRANTNIKSLQLSLGQKRKVTAQCEEILKTLQDTVQNGRSINATR
jgi:hypothetical protein